MIFLLLAMSAQETELHSQEICLKKLPGQYVLIIIDVYKRQHQEYAISYHDKDYSLNKVRLAKRDTKGIKPRI